MRCDTNVSISKNANLGTKVEVKNIGSITNCGIAIEYEAKRQEEILNRGEKIIEETRRFDDKTLSTVSLRRAAPRRY
jgi:aspartyl-tRNA(Asn)/glutamyl-tRNA(Gln) amidotransferase subunit B